MILFKHNWKFIIGAAVIWTFYTVTGCTFMPPPDPDVSPFVEKPLTPQQAIKAPVVHTVRFEGESLAIISQWYTGKAKNWRILAQINSETNPFQIPLGNQIIIPPYLVSTLDPMPRVFFERYYKATPPVPGKKIPVMKSKAGGPQKPVPPKARVKSKKAPVVSGKKKDPKPQPPPTPAPDKEPPPQPFLPTVAPELEPVGPKL